MVEGDRGRRRWRASRPFPQRGRFWVLALSLVLLLEERAVVVAALARGQHLDVRTRSKDNSQQHLDCCNPDMP